MQRHDAACIRGIDRQTLMRNAAAVARCVAASMPADVEPDQSRIDQWGMAVALQQAHAAAEAGEVPVSLGWRAGTSLRSLDNGSCVHAMQIHASR